MTKIRRIVSFVENWLMYVAITIIFILVFLTTFHVIGRLVLSSPLKGYYEVAASALLLMTFLAGAYTLRLKGHVLIDLITSHFPSRWACVINIINYVLCFFFLVFLSYQLLHAGFWQQHVGTVTAVLRIPNYLLFFTASVGCFVFAAEAFLSFWDYLTQLRLGQKED